jgi:hypothetical protein
MHSGGHYESPGLQKKLMNKCVENQLFKNFTKMSKVNRMSVT